MDGFIHEPGSRAREWGPLKRHAQNPSFEGLDSRFLECVAHTPGGYVSAMIWTRPHAPGRENVGLGPHGAVFNHAHTSQDQA